MPRTLRTFVTANGGGLGEFEYNLPGCSAPVTNPAPPFSQQAYCVKFAPGDGEKYTAAYPKNDGKYIADSWVRFTYTAPAPVFSFLWLGDYKDSVHFRLIMRSAGGGQGGRLRLIDANEDVIADSSDRVFYEDTWHRVRILCDATDAGDIIVEVSDLDGVMREVFNETGQDLDDGGSTDLRLNFSAQGAGGASPCTWYLVNAAMWSGAADRNDFLRHWYAPGYQNRYPGAQPTIGDAFDVGTCEDCGEVPFDDAKYAKYQNPNQKGILTTYLSDGGAIPGPHGDGRIEPSHVIHAASWLFRYQEAFLPNNLGKLWYGQTRHNEIGVDKTSSVDMLSMIIRDMLIVSEDPAYVPTRNDYFQYGFSQIGGPQCNVILYDAICSLLVEIVPPAPAPPIVRPQPAELFVPGWNDVLRSETFQPATAGNWTAPVTRGWSPNKCGITTFGVRVMEDGYGRPCTLHPVRAKPHEVEHANKERCRHHYGRFMVNSRGWTVPTYCCNPNSEDADDYREGRGLFYVAGLNDPHCPPGYSCGVAAMPLPMTHLGFFHSNSWACGDLA